MREVLEKKAHLVMVERENQTMEAGGSGYYGGGGGNNATHVSSGAGGSSYISGHLGCVAIKSQQDQTAKTNTEPTIEDSYHYSNKVFTDTIMIDGNGYQWTNQKQEQMLMPKIDKSKYELGKGNIDNGKAKITLLHY